MNCRSQSLKMQLFNLKIERNIKVSNVDILKGHVKYIEDHNIPLPNGHTKNTKVKRAFSSRNLIILLENMDFVILLKYHWLTMLWPELLSNDPKSKKRHNITQKLFIEFIGKYYFCNTLKWFWKTCVWHWDRKIVDLTKLKSNSYSS